MPYTYTAGQSPRIDREQSIRLKSQPGIHIYMDYLDTNNRKNGRTMWGALAHASFRFLIAGSYNLISLHIHLYGNARMTAIVSSLCFSVYKARSSIIMATCT